MMSCARGCASGACCGGNTEASGGSCSACGTEGQPCCRIAQPGCGGGLSCQANGRCAVPCGNGPGQRCCDGSTRPCPEPDRCGRGTQRCTNGDWGNCSVGPLECCNNGQCRDGKTCQNNQCRCPDGQDLIGGRCQSCGGQNEPCCSSGRPCRPVGGRIGNAVICESSNNRCTTCGGPAAPCCGPERTNDIGEAPRMGTCPNPDDFPDPLFCCENGARNGFSCVPGGC
jgi:hypothetical protein